MTLLSINKLYLFSYSKIKNPSSLFRTYVHGNRRYGYYQPNGYGQYPGQYQPDQYPGNTGLGDDKFKYDPVSKFISFILLE